MNVVTGIASAVLIIVGVVLMLCAPGAANGFVKSQAVLLQVTLGEATGHVKPIVQLVINGSPRRAVCAEISRSKLNAQAGDVVPVVYKPRGADGFSSVYVDQHGDALSSRMTMMRVAGIILVVVGAIFGVLAVII